MEEQVPLAELVPPAGGSGERVPAGKGELILEDFSGME